MIHKYINRDLIRKFTQNSFDEKKKSKKHSVKKLTHKIKMTGHKKIHRWKNIPLYLTCIRNNSGW